MANRRVVINKYFDTGPPGCVPSPVEIWQNYFCYAENTSKLAFWDTRRSLPNWDSLSMDTNLWCAIGDTIYEDDPEWVEEKEELEHMCNFHKWAMYLDSTPGERSTTKRERDAELARLDSAFAAVKERNVKFNFDFVKNVVDEMLKHRVLFVSSPAGFGKSILAYSVARELENREKGTTGGVMCRGRIDREPGELTKSLQCVPNATNAASITRYTAECAMRNASVEGLINPMLSVSSDVDPSLVGVEHVIVPYRWAERAIDCGRYKLVIMDEAHIEDAAITSVLMKTLRAMDAPPFASDHTAPNTAYCRVDRLLVYSGVRSTEVEAQFERAAHSHNLSFKAIRLPSSADAWISHRFPITQSVLQAWRPLRRPHQNDMTRLIGKLAYDQKFFTTDVEVMKDDLYFSRGGEIERCPNFVTERIVLCVRALIQHFVREGEDYRDRRTARDATGEDTSTMDPHQFPNILVYVPSTAVARQVFKRVRFLNDDNKLYPYPGRGNFIQPYQFRINVNLDEEEVSLSKPLRIFPEYRVGERDGWKKDEEHFYKGQVLIVVNGAEAGLTVDNLGAVVESGLERLRAPYSRGGRTRAYFCLTDSETMDQREGRLGRTREGIHVLAMGYDGKNKIRERRAQVVERKRTLAMRQQEFIRLVNEPSMTSAAPFRPFNWQEAVTEARVKGTLYERTPQTNPPIGTPGAAPFLTEPAARNLKLFPNHDPVHIRQLRAMAGVGLLLHGIVRCALQTTAETALKKPSERNWNSSIGMDAELNAIDCFKNGMTAYRHRLKRDAWNGEERSELLAVKPYCGGDLVALVELHAQLLVASGWNMVDPVPSQEELLQAVPAERNFWKGLWTKQQWIKENPRLRALVKKREAGREQTDDFFFLYTRLVADEERRRLWSAIRTIALGMVEAGLITDVQEVRTENKLVFMQESDPILSYNGRSLFSAIETMHSSRFAKVVGSYGKYEKGGGGKARAYFNEFFNSNEEFYKTNGAAHELVAWTRNTVVRAETEWELHPEHRWLRFDPTETCFTEDRRDLYIAVCDAITDSQLAIFGNTAGLWRVVEEETFHDDRLIGTRWLLQIELNARPSVFGVEMQMNEKEQATQMMCLRAWMNKYMPFSTHLRPNVERDRAVIIDKLIKLWNDAGPANTQVPQLPNNVAYFAD